MTLISVVIPAYNSERTIHQTILSVLNQTHQDLEVIVINDGSTDGTLAAIAQITDPRLQVFSYPNGGVSTSRNRGIEKARGEYIAFLDADDLWTVDKLEAQLAALQNHPQAAVAYSWTNYIDEADRFLYKGHHKVVNGQVYSQLFQRNFIENGSNVLVRRTALAAVGEFEPDLSPAEDLDMWLRLAARYEFVAVPQAQVLYRISSNSASTNIRRMERAILKVVDRHLALYPEVVKPLKRRILNEYYQYLTSRALQPNLTREQSWLILRLICQSIWYNPVLLRTKQKWLISVFLRIALLLFFPSFLSQTLLDKLRKLNKYLESRDRRNRDRSTKVKSA